jgi:proteasome lid subunit RPN8/RPN11
VWVSEGARETIVDAAVRAHPYETGGVLVGVVVTGKRNDRPWVTHAVEVRSRRRGRTHYQVPAGSRRRSVKRLRKVDARVGYLGDWHSHPINLGPSPKDAASIASASVSGDCGRPLLFVVLRATEGYEIDARQWSGSSLRILRVIEAGPLPPPREAGLKRGNLRDGANVGSR